MSFQRLRRRLYEAVGLGFALVPAMHACGGTAVIDGEDGSGGATSSSGSGGTTSTSSVSSSSGLDVASSTGVGGTDCVQTGSTGSGVMEVMHCLQSGQPCPQGDSAFQAINDEIWSSCCINDISCDALTDVLCGPYPTTLGPCCYQIMTEETTCATPGRPLAGAFGDLLAGTARRPGWSQGTGAASARAYWLAEARGEHASIASFLRHASELLALGAPPALVAAAFRAARDEVPVA